MNPMGAALIVFLGITLIVCLWSSGGAEFEQVQKDSKDEK
jgi:hypothetical protein